MLKSEIDELFARLRVDFQPRERVLEPGPAYGFTLGAKTVEFLLSRDAPGEIMIALFNSEADVEALTPDLFMIEEPSTRDGQSEVLRFLEVVARRYLNAPTRLRRKWLIAGPKRLEFYDGEKWSDAYRFP